MGNYFPETAPPQKIHKYEIDMTSGTAAQQRVACRDIFFLRKSVSWFRHKSNLDY